MPQPTTEYQGSFLGRISIRRNQVVSMDGNHDQELEDLELFQKHVADRFMDLVSTSPSDENAASATSPDPLLSIAWLRKLLDTFLCCEAEFKAVLIMGRDPSHIVKPPLDRLIPELLERTVKSLDICNAVCNGFESIRHCQKLAEIAVTALEQRPIGDGQIKRAKKALVALVAATSVDDKDSNHKVPERNWSFGRRNKDPRGRANFRSLSWTVAKNWSAAKQIQAMTNNLVAPRGGESTGLPMPVYIMSTIIVFVMWAMVAAIPCQERSGLVTHFPVPKQMNWAQNIIGLQEKISEEWKKKEKKGCAGLLEEMQRMEKVGQSLIDFCDNFVFPGEAQVNEVAGEVAELGEICRKMEEGLMPLQQQIREVFHRVVRSRSEVLEMLENSGKVSAPST